MSTIYTDALGNKFLGNYKWGNHDINYPTANYPITDVIANSSSFPADLEAFVSSLTTDYTMLRTTAYPLNNSNGSDLFRLTFEGDSTANATSKRFGIYYSGNHSGYPGIGAIAHNDAGNPVLWKTENGYFPADNVGNLYFVAVGGEHSVGVSFIGLTGTKTVNQRSFLYFGRLQDVNTNFGYYNSSYINQCITINKRSITSNATQSSNHYIVNAQKELLQSGDAIYPVACSNGATPTGQWATDMWVFDNNASLGYPCIGRVPNMLLGVGTFTYLKPVELITAPDAGSNLWLPVGTYAGKTLLMRCYSE